MKIKNFQYHSILSRRILKMANVLAKKENLSDEQKAALKQLRETAENHRRAFNLLPKDDRFMKEK